MVSIMSQFQNSSKLSKRPRFDLRKGAFSAVTLQVAASNYPLQFFAMPSLPSFELLLKLPHYLNKRENYENVNTPKTL